MTKIECPKCKQKTIGIIPICYRCDKKEYFKKYYLRKQDIFIESSKKRYWSNIEEERKKRREYQNNHKIESKIRMDKYLLENREGHLKNCKEYYNQNKLKWKKYLDKQHSRRETDIQYKLKDTLSTRARMAILNHGGKKQSSSIELLGAPIDIVRKHIESQFTAEMSWDNWGNKTSKNNSYDNWWEIDHIKPCASFDLTKTEEQKICFYYKNLQPLWYIENNNKSDKLDWGKQNGS